MYDILIKNGSLIDGTGKSSFLSDIGIKGEIILKIGKLDEDAITVIDASGLTVTPGFIDTHSHSDLFLIHEPEARPKIMQGITTEILGQDGLGEAPIRDDVKSDWRSYLSGLNGDPPIEWTWNTYGEYLDRVEKAEPSINVAGLVGHGNLRLLAMGMENRAPDSKELSTMKRLLGESLSQGAIGLSTGLIYPPCIYASTSELIELCKVTSEHDGVFVVHMRNEGSKLFESIEEIIQIGSESGVRVHISHLKAAGPANWGKSEKALKMLEAAAESGVKISYDQYPYTAGSTFLSSLLPTWAHEGGVEKLLQRLKDDKYRSRITTEYDENTNEGRVVGWDKVLVTYLKSEENKYLEGLSIHEIARNRKTSELEALMDLVIEEKNQVSMASFMMSEEDVEIIMIHPLGTTCTDGLLLGKPHPRAYGSFPRVLGLYVRKGVIKLEEAVRRMTSSPAKVFNLEKRGLLFPGYYADITVFDPDQIKDTATYKNPVSYPEGIPYVLVNGKVVVSHNEHTGTYPGKVIK
jgi:N-acyl-D-amino-acid deacylase